MSAEIMVVNKWQHRRLTCMHDYYIGRPSILGNPFVIHVENQRAEVIKSYHAWLREQYKKRGEVYDELMKLVGLYRDKDFLHLVCWCAPKPCHGDIIKSAVIALAKSQRK